MNACAGGHRRRDAGTHELARCSGREIWRNAAGDGGWNDGGAVSSALCFGRDHDFGLDDVALRFFRVAALSPLSMTSQNLLESWCSWYVKKG